MDMQAEKVERDVVRAVEPSRNHVGTTIRGALVLVAIACIVYGSRDSWYHLWLEFRPRPVSAPLPVTRIPPSSPCPPNTICIDNTSAWITSVSVTPQGVTVPPAPPHDPPPSPIKVGPYYYTVVWKVPAGLMGQTDTDKDTIALDSSLPFSQLRETLLHEISHACIDVGTARHVNDASNDDDFIEETVPTLLQVLHDNPKLVMWLVKEPKR